MFILKFVFFFEIKSNFVFYILNKYTSLRTWNSEMKPTT